MMVGEESMSPLNSGSLQASAGHLDMAMASPSVKRKFEETWSGPDERQSILDISLCKLRASQTVPHRTSRRLRSSEPSLRRSVLIFNTLRHIEWELRQEGVPVPPAANWAPPTEAQDTLDTPPQVDPCRTAPGWPMPCPPTDSGLVRECRATPLPMDMSCTPVVSTCPTPTCSDSDLSRTDTVHCDTAQLAATASDVLLNSDKLNLCSFRSLLDLDRPLPLMNSLPCPRVNPPVPPPPRPPSPPTFTTLTTLSPPSSLLSTNNTCSSQEQISDLDLSAYDFDLLSSFCPSLKVAPISAEELMHSVPVEPLNMNGRSTCSFRSEDIDHIMQVLVNI